MEFPATYSQPWQSHEHSQPKRYDKLIAAFVNKKPWHLTGVFTGFACNRASLAYPNTVYLDSSKK